VKVYVSVDLEGVAGVSHPDPTTRGRDGYDAAVRLMVGEANAAIEGAVAAGATHVVVNDSHGRMFNLTPADLHPAAILLQGQKPWSMVAGADPGAGLGPFDVALFVGYHARAGHPRGTIAHTFSMRPTVTRLGGRPTGEYGLNAVVLGAWGIPVGLVAGDDQLAAEVADWLPGAERVVVKTAVGGNAAASIHPERACRLIREASERAVEAAAAGRLAPLRLAPPITLEVDYARGVEADFAALLPGAERVGDRGVRFTADDMPTVYRAFVAGVRLASLVDA